MTQVAIGDFLEPKAVTHLMLVEGLRTACGAERRPTTAEAVGDSWSADGARVTCAECRVLLDGAVVV